VTKGSELVFGLEFIAEILAAKSSRRNIPADVP
jgi:hypothetical protein